MDDFILESGGRRILILHGHVFDDFIDNHPILTWLADCVYDFLQWIDRTHYFAKLAKHGSKTFLRCARRSRKAPIELARRRDCTRRLLRPHPRRRAPTPNSPIAYYNSGCWTELPCTYLTVADGAVRLHEFQPDPTASPLKERPCLLAANGAAGLRL